jgi:hypothetical protein
MLQQAIACRLDPAPSWLNCVDVLEGHMGVFPWDWIMSPLWKGLGLENLVEACR